MRVSSLGFQTDLMVQRLEGSQVEDHGDHLVVRSPQEPGYWWGNAVVLSDDPAARIGRDWESLFRQHHPAAQHRAFGVDGTSGESLGCEELVRQGCELELSDVMTATSVHEPPHPHRAAVCRPLDLTDPRDVEAALAIRLVNGPTPLPAGYEEFLVRRMATMRAIQLAGHGRWFGAFLGGEMRSGLGLVTDGSGVARYRSVDTRPDSRGQGLAGTLVHHAAVYGFDVLRARMLVIVADPEDVAISVYRSVGFTTVEKQVRLQRAPS